MKVETMQEYLEKAWESLFLFRKEAGDNWAPPLAHFYEQTQKYLDLLQACLNKNKASNELNYKVWEQCYKKDIVILQKILKADDPYKRIEEEIIDIIQNQSQITIQMTVGGPNTEFRIYCNDKKIKKIEYWYIDKGVKIGGEIPDKNIVEQFIETFIYPFP